MLLMPSSVLAADWFVDGDASGSNDGTSWANAWETLAVIDWGGGGVVADDDLYISGGTYNGTLSIGASGSSSSAPITIYTGAKHPTLSAGHTDLVIIDGTTYGINYNGYDYVTVDGGTASASSYADYNLRVTGASAEGVISNGSAGIKLLYTHVYRNGDSSSDDNIQWANCTDGSEIGWVDAEDPYVDNLKIYGNSTPGNTFGCVVVHDSYIHGHADDGVSGDGCLDFYNNQVGPWGTWGATGHADGMQMYAGNLRIYNNIFYDETWQNSTNSLIYLENIFAGYEYDNVFVYNNTFSTAGSIYDDAKYVAIYFYSHAPSENDRNNIWIVNNTFTDVGGMAIWFRSNTSSATLTNAHFENNIIYNSKQDGSDVANVDGWDFANSDITFDNNVIHEGSNGTSQVYYDTDSYSVSGLNTLLGTTNIHTAPTYVSYTPKGGLSNDYHLDASDTAAIDAGVTLAISSTGTPLGIWTDDKDEVSRPQGSSWDIGAYEYTSTGDTIAPPGKGIFVIQ